METHQEEDDGLTLTRSKSPVTSKIRFRHWSTEAVVTIDAAVVTVVHASARATVAIVPVAPGGVVGVRLRANSRISRQVGQRG